jgi:preprotein translocase subunit YajC
LPRCDSAARWTPDRAVLLPIPLLFPNTEIAQVTAYVYQILLLAEAAQPAAPADQPQADPNAGMKMVLMLLVTGVLFYFIMLRPQKKKEQELKEKVSSIKENDRVVTIGGIHGIVTNVQRDAERVTIRVDESNGTKIRFNLSAIARVVTGEDEDGASGGNKS